MKRRPWIHLWMGTSGLTVPGLTLAITLALCGAARHVGAGPAATAMVVDGTLVFVDGNGATGRTVGVTESTDSASPAAAAATPTIVFGTSDSGRYVLYGAGEKVVVQGGRLIGGHSLHVLDTADNSTRSVAPEMQIIAAAWRPGHNAFAFTTIDLSLCLVDDLAGLLIGDPDAAPRLLRSEVSGLAWSPDGAALAFTQHPAGFNRTRPSEAPTEADFHRLANSEIWIHRPDTNSYGRITDSPLDDYNPVWSPDGGSILFTSLRTGYASFFLHDLAAGTTRQLTNLQPSRHIADNIPVALTNCIEWNATSRTVAYETAVLPGEHQIWIFDPATATASPIGRGRAPRFASDGSAILYQPKHGTILKYEPATKSTTAVSIQPPHAAARPDAIQPEGGR